ncbi:hypothetical protein ACKI1I_31705 [Streptomyces turgidiscabies]|uniref:hypothetical protein n=1 Tax=Streptomyces TaxID=1883 RepID=UPI0005C9411D|nr:MULTISPECIES: hypothetical protein [Streptomyces]MDX3499184.1 hypothetical protein [Streptomyces turgidiscabies]GAQ75610.1 hypothetical protein T45_07396 [Streptomyces turgidiscabies]
MAVDPNSVRGRILYASPANSRALLLFRLLFWSTGSILAALTPVYNSGAPVWIWPPALVACLLMAGQTLGAMRRRASGTP